MSHLLENKNCLPPKYISFRNTSSAKDNVGPPLQMQKIDSANRDKPNLTAPISTLKNNNYITTHKANQPLKFNHNIHQHELVKTRSTHDDYLIILDSMDKRIKELMRQAAGLMEVILSNRKGIEFDEKVQERVRMVDEKDIEKQYRILKEKVAALRRQSITQGVMPKKQIVNQSFINPETTIERPKKLLQIQNVVNTKIIPTHRRQSSVNNLQIPSHKQHHSKQKNIQHPQHGTHFNFNHQMDHMTKRAQHYKTKTLKLEDTIASILRDKDETDRINKEIGEQIMRLRAQALSYKYQRNTI